MIRDDASLADVTTIMTHSQVLAQCKSTLAKRYPNLIQTSGKGKLIDHALVAKRLSEHKIPKEVATMGSDVLAQLYGLQIVATDLQDAQENYTSFLVVSRS
jgi:prephenate dehydratase